MPRPVDSAAAPALATALPPFDDALCLEGPATHAVFTLAGRRAVVVGREDRGVDEIRIHPLLVLGELRHESLTVHTVTVTPIGIERKLRGAGVDLVERIFVPRDLPAAILEWHAPAGAELCLTGKVGLKRVDDGVVAPSPLHWERRPRMIRVSAGASGGEASGHAAALTLSVEPAEWTVEDVHTRAPTDDAAGLTFRLRLSLAAGESARLAVAATIAGDEALTDTLDALRPEALVRARRAASRSLQRERLALSAPDASVGSALAWARHRLDGYRVDLPGLRRTLVAGYAAKADDTCAAMLDGRTAARTALAALACGDFDAAIDVIRFLGERQAPSGSIPCDVAAVAGDTVGAAGGRSDATLPFLLLVARYLAWTGDMSLVREAWKPVRTAYRRCFTDGGAADDRSLREAVRREIAMTAESIGFPLDPAADASASSSEGVAWLAGPAYAAGRGEEGFRRWSESLAACFGGARGAWSGGANGVSGANGATEATGATAEEVNEAGGDTVFADDAATTASVVSTFVYGLLGVEPDAVKGRLRLRPQIPDGWDRLEVRCLRIGDASVDLAYRRDGDRHVFRLDQSSGAVPLTLIFEPMIAARRLVAARIDGQPAELDPKPYGERMLVPVQIALDAARVVELDVAHDLGSQPGGLRVFRR